MLKMAFLEKLHSQYARSREVFMFRLKFSWKHRLQRSRTLPSIRFWNLITLFEIPIGTWCLYPRWCMKNKVEKAPQYTTQSVLNALIHQRIMIKYWILLGEDVFTFTFPYLQMWRISTAVRTCTHISNQLVQIFVDFTDTSDTCIESRYLHPYCLVCKNTPVGVCN